MSELDLGKAGVQQERLCVGFLYPTNIRLEGE